MRVGALSAVGVFMITVLLFAAGIAAAQDPGNPLEDPPPVVFEDQTIQEPIVPLEDRDQAILSMGVGCDALETPETTTTATLSISNAPASASTTLSPASTSWVSELGDCPSEDIVHEGEALLDVGFDETATAYETVTLQLEMMVEKLPPTNDTPREYGPFIANVTVTPGYLEQHEVTIDDSTQQGIAGQTLTYQASLENLANGETRFDVSVQADEALSVEVDPSEIVLAPHEPGSFTVDVTHGAPDALEEPAAYDVDLEITPASTHEKGGDGDPTSLTVVAELEPVDEGVLGAPGPAVLALVSTLGLAAVARSR